MAINHQITYGDRQSEGIAMNNELQPLLNAARKVAMSAEQREAQRRSFAYGNTAIENPLITREMIDTEAEKLRAAQSNDRGK